MFFVPHHNILWTTSPMFFRNNTREQKFKACYFFLYWKKYTLMWKRAFVLNSESKQNKIQSLYFTLPLR